MAYPTGWGRVCAVVIDNTEVSADVSDFPFLVDVNNLPSEMFDADGSYPALSGGGDIRFSSDSAGSTQLACEVVSFTIDNTPANGTAEIWVKVPSVSSSSDTTIYVWYNKSGETQPAIDSTYGAENVWASHYKGVYHFESDLLDSTSNDNDGTGSGTIAYAAAKLGKGVSLATGGSDYISLPDDCFDAIASGSLQFWGKPVTAGSTHQMIGSSATRNLIFGQITSNPYVQAYATPNEAFKMAGVTISNSSFGKTTWESSGSAWSGYFNGSSEALTSIVGANNGDWFADMATGTTSNWIGRAYGVAYSYVGILDEVRFSTEEFSSNWLATEYSSQNTPGTFASAGTPETPGGGGTAVQDIIGCGLIPFAR